MESQTETVEDMVARAREHTWPWVINLKHPVEFGSQLVTELTVRRGRLGDLKGIRLTAGEVVADHLMLVGSRMTGQPMQIIEKLDPEDAEKLLAIVIDFFGECLGGGRTR